MNEAERQHREHQAVRERLWSPSLVLNEPKPIVRYILPPKPAVIERKRATLVWVRQYNAHVIAFRRWQLAKESGSEYVEQDEKPKVEEIILAVLADFPGVTIDEVKGPRRSRRIVLPRQIAMYEVYRQRPDMSYPAIGRMFGGRDHTTCLHAVRKMTAEFGPPRVSFISCPRSV